MASSVPQEVMEHVRAVKMRSISGFLTAPWLHSPFESADWTIVIGKHRIVVNWAVSLGNSLLTDERHRNLLRALKCWVLVQSHPKVTGGRKHKSAYTYRRVTRIFSFIDYMLLNRESWGLEAFGLRAVTENDFVQLLIDIESATGFANAIYNWRERLRQWLDDLYVEHLAVVAKTLRNNPFLREMHTPSSDWRLAPHKRTLIRWRVALWAGGFYQTIGNEDFTHTIDTVKIARILYKDTLRGANAKPLFEELGVKPLERCYREKVAVPLQNTGDRPTKVEVRYQRASLRTFAALAGICEDVPVQALLSALESSVPDFESLRNIGGFAVAPFDVVMRNIECATNFFLEHGEHILESYATVFNAAKERNVTLKEFVDQESLEPFLRKETVALGVRYLSIGLRAKDSFFRNVSQRGSKPGRIPHPQIVKSYFDSLRKNEGLVELCRVVVGCVIHCIGPTTARRLSELLRLPAAGALDKSRRYIIFENAKTGTDDKREKELRPIPKLVSLAVLCCERLHEWVGTGQDGKLLEVPGAFGIRAASKSTFEICLDTFADYFEVQCDEEDRRWYVRQHQNRKFFVLAFYFGTAYGNVHVLRWMLAHGDVEHLWSYLVKTTPGDILREVQAYFLVDAFQNHPFDDSQIEIHDCVVSALQDAMEKHFGTRHFDVVDSALLQRFVEVAIKKGLKVEPRFLTIGGRKIAQIAVTISEGASI